jgi:hypothetical protein
MIFNFCMLFKESVQVPRIQSTRKVYDSSSSVTSPDAMLPGKKCLRFSNWVNVI